MSKKNLVQIIKANPGCRAVIDNDDWYLYAPYPKPLNQISQDELEAFLDGPGLLARAGEIEPLGDGGYGSGNCYGGDILQALAKIVGITVESV